MTSAVELDCLATVKSVNSRKEGPDDDKVLALDISFDADLDPEFLSYIGPTFKQACFLMNGTQLKHPAEVRYPTVGYTWGATIQNMLVTIDEIEFTNATLKKWHVRPYVNPRGLPRVEVSFMVQVKPTGREAAILLELIQNETVFKAVPNGDLFAGAPAEEAPEGEPGSKLAGTVLAGGGTLAAAVRDALEDAGGTRNADGSVTAGPLVIAKAQIANAEKRATKDAAKKTSTKPKAKPRGKA